MAKLLTIENRRLAPVGDADGAGETPAGLADSKLERLLALRAVIDSIRHERSAHLLLDWAAETNRHAPR